MRSGKNVILRSPRSGRLEGRTAGIPRRQLLKTGAAAAGALLLPGKAPAQGGAKPFSGTTLNVSCFSYVYSNLLADDIPEFEALTGAKVNYQTASFPIYNQRIDIELSTGGSAYDVLNVTFIYSGRWIGAGWFTPLDEFLHDPKKTPADWGADDFPPGTTATLHDREGRLYGIPWISDILMAGASRYDLIEKAGNRMPDTFDEVTSVMKALGQAPGIAPYITDNHYGWTFIPWLHGFGGAIFRNPPEDLMPMLDTPEAVAAADYFGNMLRHYGPDGVVSFSYEQVPAALKAGRAIYSTNNEAFLVQMAGKDSKTATTCNFSMFPQGPKGRFPGIATHGWGIPSGSKNKDAAWQFILWAVSKPMLRRMVERGFNSITRRSLIESEDFRKKLTLNGHDVAAIYRDTLALGAKGYMKYRTVPPYPQVDKQIDVAISAIASGQMSAPEAMHQAQQKSLAELKRAGVKL